MGAFPSVAPMSRTRTGGTPALRVAPPASNKTEIVQIDDKALTIPILPQPRMGSLAGPEKV